MDNIIITVTIIVGAIASAMSLASFIVVSMRKRVITINQLDLQSAPLAMNDIPISETDLEQVYKKIAAKYITSICGARGKRAVQRDDFDVLTLRANTDTLFQLQFLPWMTADRMTNTVTDLLGLNLSRIEKQYAYHMIKNNIEKCHIALSSDALGSVTRTIERVLKQLAL